MPSRAAGHPRRAPGPRMVHRPDGDRARLQLGERTIEIAEGDAAEFSTMTPHAIGCDDEPVEVLTILDRDGERAHLHPEH